MATNEILMLAAIAAYLIIVLGVGIWCSKRNNTVDDFYLGGRRLGPFVTAMSAEASDSTPPKTNGANAPIPSQRKPAITLAGSSAMPASVE